MRIKKNFVPITKSSRTFRWKYLGVEETKHILGVLSFAEIVIFPISNYVGGMRLVALS